MPKRRSPEPAEGRKGDKDALPNATREMAWLVALLVAAIVGMKAIFPGEGLLSVVKIAAGLFWMLVLPGFLLLLRWRRSLSFLERTIVAVPLSVALFGTLSYLLGILGLPVWHQAYLIPAGLSLLGLAWYWQGGSPEEPGREGA